MTLHIPTPTLNIPPAETVQPDPNLTAWAEAQLRRERAWGHHAAVIAATAMTRDQLTIARTAATPEAMLTAAAEIQAYHDERTAEDPHGDWAWLAALAESTRLNAAIYAPAGF